MSAKNKFIVTLDPSQMEYIKTTFIDAYEKKCAELSALEAELAALNALMPCGHARRYLVDPELEQNGLSVCSECSRAMFKKEFDNTTWLLVDLERTRRAAAAWKQAAKGLRSWANDLTHGGYNGPTQTDSLSRRWNRKHGKAAHP